MLEKWPNAHAPGFFPPFFSKARRARGYIQFQERRETRE